jgi:replicative DNA helicase
VNLRDRLQDRPPEMRAADAVLYLLFCHSVLAVESVEPKWFPMEYDRKLYALIAQWREAGRPPDALAFDLENKTDFKFVFNLLQRYYVVPERFGFYVETLREEFEEGSVYQLIDSVKSLSDKEAIEKVCGFAEKMKEREHSPADIYEAKGYSHAFLDKLEEARAHKEPELMTGFPHFDSYLWGLNRGELIVFGARPAVGKSALMLNIAANLLKSNKKVLYFATEMSVYEEWCRLIPILTGLDAFSFRKADFTGAEWTTIQQKVEWLDDKNSFIVCDSASPNIAQVKSMIHKVKPDVAVLDYLQRFTFPDADRSDLCIGEFMKELKTTARSENVAILLPSQLNRNVENRPSKIPNNADLRDSGNIEQESDTVILLSPDEDSTDPDNAILIANISKNRHGETGLVKLVFKKKTQRIVEL